MAEQELVDVKWIYYLGAAIVALCGTIAAMAKWIVKERTKMAEQYAKLNVALLKALDRIGDHLRDLYNKDPNGVRATRTQYNFNLNGDKNDG